MATTSPVEPTLVSAIAITDLAVSTGTNSHPRHTKHDSWCLLLLKGRMFDTLQQYHTGRVILGILSISCVALVALAPVDQGLGV